MCPAGVYVVGGWLVVLEFGLLWENFNLLGFMWKACGSVKCYECAFVWFV